MGNLISLEKRKKRKEKVNQSKKKAQVATKKQTQDVQKCWIRQKRAAVLI